jgi:hypothetical protein
MEDPIQALLNGGFQSAEPLSGMYSYLFDGQVGTLGKLLLQPLVTKVMSVCSPVCNNIFCEQTTSSSNLPHLVVLFVWIRGTPTLMKLMPLTITLTLVETQICLMDLSHIDSQTMIH